MFTYIKQIYSEELMDLNELRKSIDKIDDELLKLFEQRMKITHQVAQYKIENELEVFQSGREQAIIDKVRSKMPSELENSAETLFTTIMDISKSKQFSEFFADDCDIDYKEFKLYDDMKIACPGVEGSYTEQAAYQISKNAQLRYYEDFDDVFEAVENGEMPYGIVPIQNSTAGSVSATYELLSKTNLYIVCSTKVKITHCLACRKDTDESEIKKVFSREQGLMQCSDFIKERGFFKRECPNTSLAALQVSESSEPIACICSQECAKEYGLKVLDTNIANANENYTRFILVANTLYSSKRADIVSVTLTIPHIHSALYRLLTKFSVCGLNLVRLENKPIASKDFDAQFYLDFEGSILNPDVPKLIAELKSELSYFKFLGNYEEV